MLADAKLIMHNKVAQARERFMMKESGVLWWRMLIQLRDILDWAGSRLSSNNCENMECFVFCSVPPNGVPCTLSYVYMRSVYVLHNSWKNGHFWIFLHAVLMLKCHMAWATFFVPRQHLSTNSHRKALNVSPEPALCTYCVRYWYSVLRRIHHTIIICRAYVAVWTNSNKNNSRPPRLPIVRECSFLVSYLADLLYRLRRATY